MEPISAIAPARRTFLMPPIARAPSGEMRRAGFELEYANLGIAESADLVRQVFGGDVVPQDVFVHEVRTRYGDFTVEIDTTFLKDRKYEQAMRDVGIEPESIDRQWLASTMLDVFSTIVPIEIATAPIPIDELEALDDLRRILREAGAQGTRASLLYAFGMHINAEVPSLDPLVLLNHIRAVVLLNPWLRDRVQIDLTRAISPYTNPFPAEYAAVILREDYAPSAQKLIDDYLAWTPTRNRTLDMLPILCCLDQERVMAQVEDQHLVKARPAFHYRLPNCMVDEAAWTLAEEWNTWVAVERLAADRTKLAEMSADYLAADQSSFRPFYDKWPDVLAKYMA